MDAYLLAISAPVLISATLTAVQSYSILPVLLAYKSSSEKYSYFSGLMLICFFVLSIVFILIGLFASPYIVSILVGESYSIESRNEILIMMRISWINGGASLIIGYLGLLHNAMSRFFLPVALAIVPYGAMAVVVYMFGNTWGPVAITVGLFVGSVITLLTLLAKVITEVNLSLRCFQLWREAARYFSKTPMVGIAMLAFTSYVFVDAYWAPSLGYSNLSYLGYCQRVLGMLGTLIISGPSVMLVPYLANALANGNRIDYLNAIGRTIRTVFALASAIAVITSVLSVPLIELLFQRGEFKEDATTGVASLFPYMSAGTVAMLCVVILFRALFAQQSILLTALLGSLCAFLYFLLSGLLSAVFSLRGIGLAYILSWWITLVAALWILWNKDISHLLSRGNIRFVLHLTLSLTITGIVVAFTSSYIIIPLSDAGIVQLALRMAITLSLGFVAFYVSSVRIFRMPDVKLIFDFFEKPLLRLLRRLH